MPIIGSKREFLLTINTTPYPQRTQHRPIPNSSFRPAPQSTLLPTYGGRSWRVTVTLKEDERRVREIEKRDKKNKATKGADFKSKGWSADEIKCGSLFRWYRGELELGILPSLMQVGIGEIAKNEPLLKL